eukprot:11922081-Alexandrium_andersonii.AAC.1
MTDRLGIAREAAPCDSDSPQGLVQRPYKCLLQGTEHPKSAQLCQLSAGEIGWTRVAVTRDPNPSPGSWAAGSRNRRQQPGWPWRLHFAQRSPPSSASQGPRSCPATVAEGYRRTQVGK